MFVSLRSLSSPRAVNADPQGMFRTGRHRRAGRHGFSRRSDRRQAGTFSNGLDGVDHFIRSNMMNHVTNAGQQYQVAMADRFVQSRGLPVGI
jgi:hypothetical protein